MKLFNRITFILFAIGVIALWAGRALAQDTTLPPELLNTNVREWQLNGVTILLAIQLLGRAYAGLSKGGGLVGIFRGIVFGTNTPKVPLLLLGVSLFLAGCGTPQRPPSATEEKYYTVVTNIVPVVVLVTNRVEATETTVASIRVTPETNTVEQYTFTPNANAQLVAGTGTAVGSFWGMGGAVGGAILGAFSLWGLFRSRKSAVATAEELAQIIETGRQILLTMPNGAKYEAAWKDWMVKHQSETQVIAQVSQLVANTVNKPEAKGAAQTIVNLIQATPK